MKYKYEADVLSIGVDNTSSETLQMLYKWADVIIITDVLIAKLIPKEYDNKFRIWHVGGDKYPRPFNPELYKLAKQIIESNPL